MPRLFLIVLALFVVFMAHSKMTQMHQRVTELENEITKIHDYGLLERKQLVEDLSSTNTEQLITRINFAINAIDDSRDLQLGINQAIIALFQIRELTSAIAENHHLVISLKSVLRNANQLQDSIFDRLNRIDQLEFTLTHPKEPVVKKQKHEIHSKWYEWVRTFIYIETVPKDRSTQLGNVSLRIYIGLLEQLRYDLMNGRFDHYQVVIRRLYETGYAKQSEVKVILGALSQPLHHVDVSELQSEVERFKRSGIKTPKMNGDKKMPSSINEPNEQAEPKKEKPSTSEEKQPAKNPQLEVSNKMVFV